MTKVNGNVVANYSFVLDKVGNITKQTAKEPYDGISLTNEDVSYSYNSGNRITSAGDISFNFDENGNTIIDAIRGDKNFSYTGKVDVVCVFAPVYERIYTGTDSQVRCPDKTGRCRRRIHLKRERNCRYAREIRLRNIFRDETISERFLKNSRDSRETS